MAISTEGRIGIGLALVFGLGTGAVAVWPEAKIFGILMMSFSFWGLVALAAYHFLEAVRLKPAATCGAAVLAFIATAWGAEHFTAPPPVEAAPEKVASSALPKPDPHGICFVDFKVWHHDQKIAITAVNINQNKQTVMTTLIGRHFTLSGFPRPPEPESDESKPLYPEQRTVAYDSAVISLGKDIPKGTVLMGRVYFLIRYGPSVDNTVALKIKGTVPIKVGALKNGGDAAFWTPDKDSTPDCPGVENLIGQNWISASQPS